MTLEFLTVKGVAKLLGASEKIFYTVICSGRLRATNWAVYSFQIAWLLAHKSVKITLIYTKLKDKRKIEAEHRITLDLDKMK